MWAFISPSSQAFSRISCGHVPSLSNSQATGRISFSAKSWAISRSAICSSVSVKSTIGTPCQASRLTGQSTQVKSSHSGHDWHNRPSCRMRSQSWSSPSWSSRGWSPSRWPSARAGPMTRSAARTSRSTAKRRNRRTIQTRWPRCWPRPTPGGPRTGVRRSRSRTSAADRMQRYAPKSGRSWRPATRAASRAGARLWTWKPRSSGVFRAETGSLPLMPALRRFDVDELLTRPGTYFHPETEIVLIVDDSAHVDLELLGDEEDDAAEWILLGDDPAIDEHKRDELVEAFETRRARSSTPDDPDAEDEDDEEELEPDPDEY